MLSEDEESLLSAFGEKVPMNILGLLKMVKCSAYDMIENYMNCIKNQTFRQ